MPAQLTAAEQERIDQLVRKEKKSGAHASNAINMARKKRGIEHIEKKAIYSYIRGETHTRTGSDERGANAIVTKAHIRTLLQTRRRLIQAADGEERVTYKDVIDEANLDLNCCQKTIEVAIRKATELRYRPARAKVQIKEQDAKLRRVFVKKWLKKPKGFWSKQPRPKKGGVHGYYDCKLFPLALTPAQKKRFNQTTVVGHLRLPSEGTDRGFTKPRQKHAFLGMPSVNIAAVVSQDRIIMWKAVEGSWNGARAAETYEHMGKALKKRFGEKRSFTLVEDGDRKGNQSNKGKNAKKKAKIHALTLPPRTPSLMPLDYSIWKEVLKRMKACEPTARETKGDFIDRLRRCAMRLPRGYVGRVLDRMKDNLKALKEAKGYTPKND
jgi:hypothetical protein